MKTAVVWKDGIAFDARAGDHSISLDTKPPMGKDSGPSPKELVAMGLGGCTAMDVIALLKKYKQTPSSFRVETEVQMSSGQHPIVFEKAVLSYVVEGDVEAAKLSEAIHLSQTKYCGVSAMLAKAFPIEYRVLLNGTEIVTNTSEFTTPLKESV
jgi:putative redox protein